MVNLQASLLCNPSFSPLPLHFSSSSSSSRQRVHFSLPLLFPTISRTPFGSCRFRFGHRSSSSVPCTLNPGYGNFNSESISSPGGSLGSGSQDLNIGGFGDQGADFNGSKFEGSESSEILMNVEAGVMATDDNAEAVLDSPGSVELDGFESGIESETEGKWRKLPFVVFLMGLWATMKSKFQKVIEIVMDWYSWWPFWRQEKRLERLTAEADANPKDAAKQSALLAELNKQR